MADRTPSLLPLSNAHRFEVPDYDSYSTSPSPAPATRHEDFVSNELDPLLANLSPISTLEALKVNDAVSPLPGSKEDLLASSITEASENERALAIRAALAGKKLRGWVEEIREWHWPLEKFEPLQPSKQLQNTNSISRIAGTEQVTSPITSRGSMATYFGSLPATVVLQRENRIERIRDDMETLELEELKSYVRGAHSQLPKTVPYDSPAGMLRPSQYTRLGDFTVVITATIVQALPFLARLEKLLGRWSVRLFVLRQVPSFLQQLEDTQVALQSAWVTLKQEAEKGLGFEMTRETYMAIKGVLQSRVSELAKKIDSILDAVEGFEDRIPDHWIDNMEAAETDFQDWIVEAERLIELSEWQSCRIAESNIKDESYPDQGGAKDNQAVPVTPTREYLDIYPSANTGIATALSGREEVLYDDDHLPAEQAGEPAVTMQHSNDQASEYEGTPTPDKKTPVHGLFFMRNTESKLNADADKVYSNATEKRSQHSKPCPAEQMENEGGGLGENAGHANSRVPVDVSVIRSSSQNATTRRFSTRKPPPLNLDRGEVESAPDSETSHTTFASASSGAFSDMSNPQIMDASPVQFFKTPMEDRFPVWVTQDDSTPSRQSSQGTTKELLGHGRSFSAVEPSIRRRASSHLSDVTISGHDDMGDQRSAVDGQKLHSYPEPEVHGASTVLIESIPRSELQNIAIGRISGSKPGTRGELPLMEDDIAAQIAQTQRELETEHSDNEPSDWNTSPSLRPKKVRDIPIKDNIKIEELQSASPASQNGYSSHQKVVEDKLSAKINSILSRVPAAIKLARTPLPKKNDASTSGKKVASNVETPPQRPFRTISSTPLTLVPANTSTPTQHHEGEGKLYELHQHGKEVPVKLFIRLVGSEERVMVRVGGGWADLAEYLKEYAVHHQHQGRRSVSDNRFEIQSLSGSTTGVPSLGSVSSGRSPAGSVSGGTPNSRPRTPGTHQPSGLTQSSAGAPSEQLEETPTSNTIESTPNGLSSGASRQDQGSSLGLAGPKGKKLDMSPQKKAWVSDMLSQARHLSFEHKKPDSSGPGDSGGKTKRVFMRAKADE